MDMQEPCSDDMTRNDGRPMFSMRMSVVIDVV